MLPGSVASITGGLLASGPDAAALNDNQVFLMHVSPELRRRYESTLLSQVEQVGGLRTQLYSDKLQAEKRAVTFRKQACGRFSCKHCCSLRALL
jgi:hypothetical protein